MNELFYSKKSHRKIVHLSHCKIFLRVPMENRCSFESLEQAQEQGYRLCNCCPPAAQAFRKEQAEIKSFCKDTDFTCILKNNEIHIISKYDCWRIIAEENSNKLILYHKNTKVWKSKRSQPSGLAGYHVQKCRYNSILEYLKYIQSHDQYRENLRTTEKCLDQDDGHELPEWVIWKYGEEYLFSSEPAYTRKKGTKAYKKEQKRRKREKRRVSIDRVNAIFEEMKLTI